MTDTRWIMFAKRSSRDNCIGKGRILDCFVFDRWVRSKLVTQTTLHIDMTLDGVRFVGNIEEMGQEEE